jgi:replicative DNA helicase
VKYNWEVERAVLGGLMLDVSQLDTVSDLLQPGDFHRPHHAELYKILLELGARGAGLDVVSVIDELRKREAGEAVGGIAYVAQLPTACPSTEALHGYAERVREHSVRRALAATAERILADVKAGEKETSELLDEAEREVFALGQSGGRSDWHDVSTVVDEHFVALQDRARQGAGELTGTTTGFADLDRVLSGFQPTDLVILGARPGMGKTSLALNMALAAAEAGKAVGIFSLEMSRHQLVSRFLSSRARIDSAAMRTARMDDDEWRRLARATEEVQELPIEIDDTPGLALGQLRAKARRLRARRPDLGLLVLDYLQLMQGSGGPRESRENAISAISRGLKIVAKELGVPILALSQLNRALEGRTDKRPQLSDLRESGAIEQDADVIMFIYRDEKYDEASERKGLAEVIVAKHRAGATGKVTLTFDAQWTLFHNYAGDTDPGYG